jgi:hypothetical protein
MAIFYTDSGSLRDLKVSGSTLMSASTGLALQLKSSGSTLFSVSGSGGEIFNVSDIGSSTALFTISSGSTTIVNVDNTKNVAVSGSLQVTGSAYIKGLTTTAQASFVSIDTSTGQLYTAGTSSFTASWAVSASRAISSSYAFSSSYALSSSYASGSTSASYASSSTSASYASSSTSASYASSSTSASYALTASNVQGGTNNYLPIWSGSTQLSSSIVYQSGSNIGIGTGTTTNQYKLLITGSGTLGSFNANDILTVSGSNAIITGSLRQGNINPAISIGAFAHAEGYLTQATGPYAHAEGDEAVSSGRGSHAEGFGTRAVGSGSHAEGFGAKSTANQSHAEGFATETFGSASHAEGNGTKTYGVASHAEGNGTTAYGNYSHAEGEGTISSGSCQLAIGQYNKQNNTTSLFVIGNGLNTASRSDILNVTTSSFQVSGSHTITGSLFVDGTVNFTNLGTDTQSYQHVLSINTGSGYVSVRPISTINFDYFGSYYSITTQTGIASTPQTIKFEVTRSSADVLLQQAQYGIEIIAGNTITVLNDGWYDITAVLNINDSSFGTNPQQIVVYPQYSADNSTWLSFPSSSIRCSFTGANNSATTTYRLFLKYQSYYRLRWMDVLAFGLSTLSIAPIIGGGEISGTPSTMLDIRFVSVPRYTP